jgi:gamma-glutamyltranspeptidase/glutathione hydrolase
MQLLRILVAVLLVWGGASQAAQAQGAETPIIVYDTQFHPTLARNGMVVSQSHYASDAGLSVLKAGGNAVDAAVATGFALAVTHPQAGNLGGGGFMMVYLKAENRVIAIDYREMAPAAAHRDMFLDEDGNVHKTRSRFSLKASGVPGTVMGLTEALAKYGTMPLSDVMAPAIALAEDGFVMTWGVYESLCRYQRRLKADATSAAK